MNRNRALGPIILAVLCASLTASSVEALANRVFVSARSGNDANSCDNINTPCQTFAGAVLQLNPGGDAIVLDTGGYGPVTITQSLTIEAAEGVTAFIHPPAGDAVTISAGAADTVVLRGLVLNGGAGSGNGIVVSTVGTLHIENCVISGFVSRGILVSAAGSNIFLNDTISRQNLVGAEFLNGAASIDHCRFERNGLDGISVENADVTVRDSVTAGNGVHGFHASAAGVENTVLDVYQCMSTSNGADGLRANNTGTGVVTARVAGSSTVENVGIGLNNAGGTVTFESLVDSLVRGNGTNTNGTITPVLGQ